MKSFVFIATVREGIARKIVSTIRKASSIEWAAMPARGVEVTEKR